MESHWSQSPSGALLARAISFLFSKFIQPARDGGLKDFIEEHCSIFRDWDIDSEQRTQYFTLFSDFEKMMDKFLEDFAELEGLTSSEVMATITRVAEGNNNRAIKGVQTLLRGLEYRKFCSIMKNKAEALTNELKEVVPHESRLDEFRHHHREVEELGEHQKSNHSQSFAAYRSDCKDMGRKSKEECIAKDSK
jgi:hypothetical protein